MKLRRWAWLTVCLYVLTLAALIFPLIWAAFAGAASWNDAVRVCGFWPFWLFIGMLGLLEAGFLFLPIQIERRRPRARGRWIWLALVAGLMLGLLTAAFFLAVSEALVEKPTGIEEEFLLWAAGFGLVAWAGWGLLFLAYSRGHDDQAVLRKAVHWLLKGSVAELLVAVPSHVYARHKNYCCAGAGTFLGIAMGLSVLLFAFGPGVFFLFVARVKRLQGANPAEASTATPKPGLMGPQGRDALAWMAAACTFFAGLAFLVFGYQDAPDEMAVNCGIGGTVLTIAAVSHALRASLCKEPLWGLVLALAAFLSEAAFLLDYALLCELYW